MGGKCPCNDLVIPERPDQELCISNGTGGAACFDPRLPQPRYSRSSIPNYVCTNPIDSTSQEKWIDSVLRLIEQ